MKFKKLSIIVLSLGLLVGIGSFFIIKTSAKDETTQFKEFGQYIKSIKDTKSSKSQKLDKTQYIILEQYYKNIVNQSAEEAKASALNQTILEAAVIEKAKEQNLFPSANEIQERVKQERINFENASKENEDNQKVSQMVNSLAEGLGMTLDEYWSSYVPKGYEFTISEERLLESVTKNIKDPNEQTETWNKYLSDVTEEFKKNNSIEIDSFQK
ncbi:hypothetical protein M3685_26585 [Heyndrickxia oleronia]|uniref:hypothetical protein n=1 Tax=Heyndrickxia oleronia TaxID=38875 RepID=UPI0015D39733|nr:hypothetical protein [Heyndrickxia oleronia]MCM3457441.1 hypothetical protein [Heyndrickxia oleronia]NYV68896.1 hypothetical protein [Bacillus sp. Gen3]